MTRQGGCVGEATRTSSFDFDSGLDPDPDFRCNTKRKLFSIAEVRTPPSTILFCFVSPKRNKQYTYNSSHSSPPYMINSKYHFKQTLYIHNPQINVLTIGVQKHLIQIYSPFTGSNQLGVCVRHTTVHSVLYRPT